MKFAAAIAKPLAPALRRVIAHGQRVAGGLGLDAHPGTLLLVTGGGDWAVKQIALSLQGHLQGSYRQVQMLEDLRQRPYVTQANIHCLCRPAFFGSEGVPEVHSSNRLVVSWLHGGKDSLDRHIVSACAQLERHWRKVRRFIVPNSITHHKLLDCGVDPAVIHRIPNGVDTRLFRPAADEGDRQAVRQHLGIPLDAFVVGSFQRDEDKAGQPKLIKGPDILVATLAAVHRQRPLVALLTGPGRSYVQRQLQERGVPHFHHWLKDQEALAQAYHAIDAYLITSREEGGPTALRESMASGTPVVSTRMGLAADLIQSGVNGFLADIDDVEGLADGLLQLIERPALREPLAAAALTTIRPLDYTVIARRYEEEVYRLAFG